jgi:hypothetical protein
VLLAEGLIEPPKQKAPAPEAADQAADQATETETPAE